MPGCFLRQNRAHCRCSHVWEVPACYIELSQRKHKFFVLRRAYGPSDTTHNIEYFTHERWVNVSSVL